MSSEGNRLALIFACNRYSDQKLKELQAPSQDAERLARILEDPKIGRFKVTTLIDQPHWIIAGKLNEVLKSCSKKDTLLLYFSCHGVKDEDGQLYFATVTTDRTLLYSTGVDSIFVNRMLDRCQAQQKVVLLDCCYSGAFEKGSTSKADTQVNVVEFLGKGRVLITASDAMQYAFEGTDKVESLGIGGSYFTNGLIKGLETGEADVDNDGRITYSELYRYVHDYVRNITPNQTPTLSTKGVQGDFVIFKNIREDLGSSDTQASAVKRRPKEDTSKGEVQEVRDSILEFIEMARVHLKEKHYDDAIKVFDVVLMRRSEHVEALNGKGMALYKQKKYKDASECFEKVLKIEPGHLEACDYLEMITDRLSKEHNDGEIKSSDKDIKQDTAALEKRTEEKVIDALDKTTQITSELIKKGDQFYEDFMYQKAILCYDQALNIEPRSESAWNNKGLALNNLGKYKEAIKHFDRALEIEPNYYGASINKGATLSNMGNYEEAIICYDKALELNPENADVWNNKGLAFNNLGKYEEAIKCCDKAIELNPNFGLYWQNKAYFLERFGKIKYAKECSKKAKKLGF